MGQYQSTFVTFVQIPPVELTVIIPLLTLLDLAEAFRINNQTKYRCQEMPFHPQILTTGQILQHFGGEW